MGIWAQSLLKIDQNEDGMIGLTNKKCRNNANAHFRKTPTYQDTCVGTSELCSKQPKQMGALETNFRKYYCFCNCPVTSKSCFSISLAFQICWTVTFLTFRNFQMSLEVTLSRGVQLSKAPKVIFLFVCNFQWTRKVTFESWIQVTPNFRKLFSNFC